jgi:hypothetical protein
MIAKSNSSTDSESESTPSTSTAFLEGSPLSADELYQLTLYKWRYSLEAYGFEPEEVRSLMFMKWLCASHRVQG